MSNRVHAWCSGKASWQDGSAAASVGNSGRLLWKPVYSGISNRFIWTDSVCRTAWSGRLVQWVSLAIWARASTLVNTLAASQQPCTRSCPKPASIRRLPRSPSPESSQRQVQTFIAAARSFLCRQREWCRSRLRLRSTVGAVYDRALFRDSTKYARSQTACSAFVTSRDVFQQARKQRKPTSIRKEGCYRAAVVDANVSDKIVP